MKITLYIFFLVLVNRFSAQAIYNEPINLSFVKHKTLIVFDSNRPNPVFELFKKKQKKNKQVTAAVLSFPFPFGIVGLHRIYLGTAPHVPVVYIGTLGGAFGILPLIDFVSIIITKNFDSYKQNKQIFMWAK